jgi:hypothetical protein
MKAVLSQLSKEIIDGFPALAGLPNLPFETLLRFIRFSHSINAFAKVHFDAVSDGLVCSTSCKPTDNQKWNHAKDASNKDELGGRSDDQSAQDASHYGQTAKASTKRTTHRKSPLESQRTVFSQRSEHRSIEDPTSPKRYTRPVTRSIGTGWEGSSACCEKIQV